MSGLRPVIGDQQLTVLRILLNRRRALGDNHTRMVSQLHQLLLELIPGRIEVSEPISRAQQRPSRPR